MTQTLEQLSAAATQGEWISIQSSIDPERHYITNDHHAIFASEIGGTRPADLKFVTSLVNLYRTGQLVAVQPDDATVERYRHKKRGTVYEVIGEAELQMNTDNLVDGSQMMVYRGEDGKLWCRHYDEFHDGRFAAMKGPNP